LARRCGREADQLFTTCLEQRIARDAQCARMFGAQPIIGRVDLGCRSGFQLRQLRAERGRGILCGLCVALRNRTRRIDQHRETRRFREDLA